MAYRTAVVGRRSDESGGRLRYQLNGDAMWCARAGRKCLPVKMPTENAGRQCRLRGDHHITRAKEERYQGGWSEGDTGVHGSPEDYSLRSNSRASARSFTRTATDASRQKPVAAVCCCR